MDSRSRLLRIYTTYAPDKLVPGFIDKTLNSFRGEEAALFDTLKKKYFPNGQEPPPPPAAGEMALSPLLPSLSSQPPASHLSPLQLFSASSPSPGSPSPSSSSQQQQQQQQQYTDRQRIEAIYTTYAPDKLNDPGFLDRTLASVPREQLFSVLKMKYFPTREAPTPAEAAAASAARARGGGGGVLSSSPSPSMPATSQLPLAERSPLLPSPAPASASPAAAPISPVASHKPSASEAAQHASHQLVSPPRMATTTTSAAPTTDNAAAAGSQQTWIQEAVAAPPPSLAPETNNNDNSNRSRNAPTGPFVPPPSSATNNPLLSAGSPSAAQSWVQEQKKQQMQQQHSQLLRKKQEQFVYPHDNSTRARLERFWKKYAPERLPEVGSQLETWAGREEEMWSQLCGIYGPEPKLIDPLSSSPIRYRRRLVTFWRKYNQARLSLVDGQLEACRGAEEEYFRSLVKQYGPEPEPGALTEHEEAEMLRLEQMREERHAAHLQEEEARRKRNETLESWARPQNSNGSSNNNNNGGAATITRSSAARAGSAGFADPFTASPARSAQQHQHQHPHHQQDLMRNNNNDGEGAVLRSPPSFDTMPGLNGHTVVAFGDSLLVYGGLNSPSYLNGDCFAFDLSTEHWSKLATIGINSGNGDQQKPLPRAFHSAVMVDNRMYVFGGLLSVGLDDVHFNAHNVFAHPDVVVAENAVLRQTPHKARDRLVADCQQLWPRTQRYLEQSALHVLDVSEEDGTAVWCRVAATGTEPPARAHHSAALFNEQMFICGGYSVYSHGMTGDPDSHACASLYSLHAVHLIWRRIETAHAPWPARWGAASALAPDGRWFFVGGVNPDRGPAGTAAALVVGETSDVFALDLRRREWSKVQRPDPELTFGPDCAAMQAAVSFAGTLYVLHGASRVGTGLLEEVKAMNEGTGAWETVHDASQQPLLLRGQQSPSSSSSFNNKNIPAPRSGHAAVVVGYELYIVGGLVDTFHGLRSREVFCFNFLTRHWRKLGCKYDSLLDEREQRRCVGVPPVLESVIELSKQLKFEADHPEVVLRAAQKRADEAAAHMKRMQEEREAARADEAAREEEEEEEENERTAAVATGLPIQKRKNSTGANEMFGSAHPAGSTNNNNNSSSSNNNNNYDGTGDVVVLSNPNFGEYDEIPQDLRRSGTSAYHSHNNNNFETAPSATAVNNNNNNNNNSSAGRQLFDGAAAMGQDQQRQQQQVRDGTTQQQQQLSVAFDGGGGRQKLQRGISNNGGVANNNNNSNSTAGDRDSALAASPPVDAAAVAQAKQELLEQMRGAEQASAQRMALELAQREQQIAAMKAEMALLKQQTAQQQALAASTAVQLSPLAHQQQEQILVPSMSPAVNPAMRARLMRYYQHHNAAKATPVIVEQALVRYLGNEEEMFAQLISRYGPEPPDPAKAAAAPLGAAVSSPSSSAAVAQTPAQPAAAAPAAASAVAAPVAAASSAAPGGIDPVMRARLVRYYQFHNATKMTPEMIDSTLARYVGKEEAMFAQLVARYGPEPPADSPPAAALASAIVVSSSSSSASATTSAVTTPITQVSQQQQQQQHPAAKSTTPTTVDPAMRARLTRYYKFHNADKATPEMIENTLVRYIGNEESLFAQLVARYGPEPPNPGTATAVGGSDVAASSSSTSAAAAAAALAQQQQKQAEMAATAEKQRQAELATAAAAAEREKQAELAAAQQQLAQAEKEKKERQAAIEREFAEAAGGDDDAGAGGDETGGGGGDDDTDTDSNDGGQQMAHQKQFFSDDVPVAKPKSPVAAPSGKKVFGKAKVPAAKPAAAAAAATEGESNTPPAAPAPKPAAKAAASSKTPAEYEAEARAILVKANDAVGLKQLSAMMKKMEGKESGVLAFVKNKHKDISVTPQEISAAAAAASPSPSAADATSSAGSSSSNAPAAPVAAKKVAPSPAAAATAAKKSPAEYEAEARAILVKANDAVGLKQLPAMMKKMEGKESGVLAFIKNKHKDITVTSEEISAAAASASSSASPETTAAPVAAAAADEEGDDSSRNAAEATIAQPATAASPTPPAKMAMPSPAPAATAASPSPKKVPPPPPPPPGVKTAATAPSGTPPAKKKMPPPGAKPPAKKPEVQKRGGVFVD